ncbi:MAG: hypothetical protein P9L92_16565 [Candidatus Electryonea clarkiae]|nr:hypothetical protein [Candidatus Electryonea clarkiae]MDP8288023.1 hypothetical protein [Candidatus Electryonea clarkiae]
MHRNDDCQPRATNNTSNAIRGYLEALVKRNWDIPEEPENFKPFVKDITVTI